MIITKDTTATAEQLNELEQIVGDFGCKIQVIHGADRDIYAIIGDERSETMVNRILGLHFVDRVDRVESVYKLMDIRSDLSHHRFSIGAVELKKEPLFIAGHCTIDPQNPNLFYETAHAVKEAGAHVLRGGVWKPRTSPHSYQGSIRALGILMNARDRTGLPVTAEVMDAMQVKVAIDAGVDVLQIGARNALNYPLLKRIGEATSESCKPILLKRAMHMGPVDEFISAAEYIVSNGNPNVIFCPRGTQPKLDAYRNHPDESITPLLKEKSWAPVVVDPSHSVGRSMYVPSAALSAMAYGADGLIIEAHIKPQSGIGDDPKQALCPAMLQQVLQAARQVWSIRQQVHPTPAT